MDIPNEKTSIDHWEETLVQGPKMRLPSPLVVSSSDRMRLLKADVKPGMRYLEIGCAPGKMLAYVARVLGARVAGLDYSPRGIEWTGKLFDALQLEADLRCEDVFATSFEPGSFDVVHSAGVIEHFDDPTDIVRIHVSLLKPGGIALITIPNLGGFYRRPAEYFDLEVVRMHNLRIMNCEALARLAPGDLTAAVSAFPSGRLSFGAVHFRNRFSPRVTAAIYYATNLAGLMQPFEIPHLCPQLVLRMVRKER